MCGTAGGTADRQQARPSAPRGLLVVVVMYMLRVMLVMKLTSQFMFTSTRAPTNATFIDSLVIRESSTIMYCPASCVLLQ